MNNPETAKRLQEAIRVNNMIPQELADRTGISKASISQYLSGQHKPSNGWSSPNNRINKHFSVLLA